MKNEIGGDVFMKCSQCGIEFEGKFCPECGTKTEATAEVMAANQKTFSQPAVSEVTKTKKKKPFYLRWWFILLAIVLILILALFLSGRGEKIHWSDLVLGGALPEPPVTRGEIQDDSFEELWVDINNLSAKQYADYIESCKNMGFSVDAKTTSYSYDAYNKAGYKLHLYYYESDEQLMIQLDKPMDLADITWPTSMAGKQLPAPKSTIGKFSYEYEDNFFVYIGNTSKADYTEYVNACSQKGFNVDYSKGDNYYYADNTNGWHISLKYEGNNVMSIDIDSPSDETAYTTKVTTTKTTTTNSVNNIGISADFKAAMDSYESFMDEYIAFMKKYKDNPSDLSLLTDYADYMSKYADFVEDFEGWEDEDMNAAELSYYLDVQTRVSKKLLEVAQ